MQGASPRIIPFLTRAQSRNAVCVSARQEYCHSKKRYRDTHFATGAN